MSSDESTAPESQPHGTDSESETVGQQRPDGESAERASNDESKLPRRLVLGSLALSVAAFVVAALFGVMWLTASAGEDTGLASAREDVVRTGSSAVKAFTELDHRNPDAFFDHQAAVSTKELADQINQTRDKNTQTLADAKTVATTEVLDIAVDELNQQEGKARFLAAIQVSVKQGDKSNVKPLRIEGNMTKVGQDWKLASIQQVPVANGGN